MFTLKCMRIPHIFFSLLSECNVFRFVLTVKMALLLCVPLQKFIWVGFLNRQSYNI